MDAQVVRIALLQDESILMLRRSSHDDYPDWWELPGGSIENENDRRAVERELAEETGLVLTQLGSVCSEYMLQGPGGTFVERTYLGEYSGNVTLSSDHSSFYWFKLDAHFPDLTSPSALQVVRLLQAHYSN